MSLFHWQHEGEFDALNLRIEDLQESIKRIRESLVQAVRAVRVNKFGEETQELRLRPRGGGEELRLLPPCGNGLEHCVCWASSSPPKPVCNGSLPSAIEAAREAAAAAAAAAVADRGPPRERGNDDHRDDGNSAGGSAAAAGREAKRRRVLNDPGSKRSDEQERGGARMRRASQAESASASSDVPLDEIKRQMGKNPLELERRKDAFEEETRTAGGSSSGDHGGTSRSADPLGRTAEKTKPAQEGRGAGRAVGGRVSGETHAGDASAVRVGG